MRQEVPSSNLFTTRLCIWRKKTHDLLCRSCVWVDLQYVFKVCWLHTIWYRLVIPAGTTIYLLVLGAHLILNGIL